MSYLRYLCLFVGRLMSYLRYLCLFVGRLMSYLRYLCLFVGRLMSYLRYLCLFVGRLMSYLRYLCLFAHNSDVHQILCVFLFCFSSSCVPYVASFSGLSIFDCPFGIL
jgi:hypothetical protein